MYFEYQQNEHFLYPIGKKVPRMRFKGVYRVRNKWQNKLIVVFIIIFLCNLFCRCMDTRYSLLFPLPILHRKSIKFLLILITFLTKIR